jgi:8-amino-7-oxononanoate synthase
MLLFVFFVSLPDARIKNMKEDFLNKKIAERKDQNAFRGLKIIENKIDFCSNDYLGIARRLNTPDDKQIHAVMQNGSTGSRLLSGNYALIEEVEKQIAHFHNAETGLIFNSGYDANLGLLSCIPQRNDTILYDFLSHASIRDGIRLNFAHSMSFGHNDTEDLERKIQIAKGNIFVVTESVFSMDGDVSPLAQISRLCEKYDANLIIDEAHATGIIGENGEGLVQHLGLEKKCFARMHTFGKAVGCHGAIVMGSKNLREYLINFSRPFIYTTSLPPSSIAAIKESYEIFPAMHSERICLRDLIALFQSAPTRLTKFTSSTPIQVVLVPGNDKVKIIANRLQENGMDVRAIVYPTIPKGSERLRIALHAFNKPGEVGDLIDLLNQ